MARRRAAAATDESSLGEVIRWYREQLDADPVFPWNGLTWEPIRIGPTWRTEQVAGRRRWALPEATLGWDVLGWCGLELQHAPGRPWKFTLEQARWLLWWFSLTEDGSFVYHDGVLQRLKGWGKDPIAAILCLVEAFGPSRFAGWDGDRPLAADCPNAWVQIAAAAQEQTKTTNRLFPGLLTADAVQHYRIQLGRLLLHGYNDERLIQSLTSSPATIEGARSTFVAKNETQHWDHSNAGFEMAAVIERNATKAPDAAARTMAFTNAYDPSMESVARSDREAYELADAGESLTTGIFYDSLEAPREAPLTAEAAPEVVEAIRGDSIWLSPTRIVKSILDTRNPPSRSRRFWYNQIWAAEDAWVVPLDFDACARAELGTGETIDPGEQIALFFDGSKSDDATGLVARRISDGHAITLGLWQRPPGERGKGWLAPREAIDQRVMDIFDRLRPVAFYADPSHSRDDETQERYWDALIDEWHRRYRKRLSIWAVPGKDGHSVMWDMTSPKRIEKFTAAAERCAKEIEEHTLTHDGDARLRIHVQHARRAPNRYGVSVAKEHRESSRKIDLAVCLIGSGMARRDYLNQDGGKKPRSGRVW